MNTAKTAFEKVVQISAEAISDLTENKIAGSR